MSSHKKTSKNIIKKNTIGDKDSIQVRNGNTSIVNRIKNKDVLYLKVGKSNDVVILEF